MWMLVMGRLESGITISHLLKLVIYLVTVLLEIVAKNVLWHFNFF